MKAKQLKNGTWTISGVSSDTIVAVAKVLDFALREQMAYGYYIAETRKKIDNLRNDGDTLDLAGNVEFLFRCIREHDIEK